MFSLDANGNIVVDKKLDYETKKFYSLVATVKDFGLPRRQATALVEIFIADVDDERPFFIEQFYSITVTEKLEKDTVLVTLLADDKDSSNLIYSPTQTLDSHFRMQDNKIVLDRIFDTETESNVYTMSFTVSDGTRTSDVASVTINVVDVNDNEPIFAFNEYSFDVDEGAENVQLMTVTASDKDISNKHNQLTYSIIPNSDSSSFELIGRNLMAKGPFDHEVKKSYEFFILANDTSSPGHLTAKALVRVKVNDLNDNSPVPRNSSVTVTITEDTQVGSVILVIWATDNDSGVNGEIEYLLTDTTFSITDKGEIKTRARLEHFVKNRYNFNVVLRDKGLIPNSAIVEVTVIVTKVVLPGIQIDGCTNGITVNLTENSIPTNSILTLRASDTGLYQTQAFNYKFNGGDDEIFTITDSQVFVKTAANFERKSTYQFLVQASNERSSRDECLVTVNVLDANESPVFKQSQYTFQMYENEEIGTVVFSVAAQDPDYQETLAGQLKYSIVDQENTFTINDNGQILLDKRVDFENKQTLAFQVTATDNGVPQLSASATVIELIAKLGGSLTSSTLTVT